VNMEFPIEGASRGGGEMEKGVEKSRSNALKHKLYLYERRCVIGGKGGWKKGIEEKGRGQHLKACPDHRSIDLYSLVF